MVILVKENTKQMVVLVKETEEMAAWVKKNAKNKWWS